MNLSDISSIQLKKDFLLIFLALVVLFGCNAAETTDTVPTAIATAVSTPTVDQLRVDQKVLNQQLKNASFSYSTSVLSLDGVVELILPAPEVWEAFVAVNPIDLPETVVLTYAFDQLPPADPPAGFLRSKVYMAQVKFPDLLFMESLNNSLLTVEDGCLFSGSGDSRRLIVWQPGYYPVKVGDGIVIIDQHGEQAAALGEPLFMGGGYINLVSDDKLVAPVPTVCKTSRVYLMGEFLPEEYRD